MQRMRSSAATLVALLCLWSFLLGSVTAGPVMAVDLGGEFLKVAVVRPGRAVSIAINEFSKRKTSGQVAFVNGERLLGEDAAALSPRYPDLVYGRARDLLGKVADDPAIRKVQQSSSLLYAIVPEPERRTAAVKAGKQMYSAEELVASLLHYAKGIAEKASEGAAVLDCTIAVPAHFGPAQRQAIVDAAEVAGLNVLALVNSHAAAALQYGYYRTFENRTDTVLLYDLGATTASAALVRFSGSTVDGTGSTKGKAISAGKLVEGMEVLDVAWDADIGVESLDRLLIEHFAAEFRQKHKKDILLNPKAVAKLKRQVKRTKEILSANLNAPISVEEVMDGMDLRSSISRQAFEELAGDFFLRAAAPAADVLARNGVEPEELAAVELLGGGSRIPGVKAALSAALGGRPLDMHLDADEAVALGAGLVAANRSSTFRLRRFGAADGAVYPVIFQVKPSKGVITEGAEGLLSPKTLLPLGKRLPAERVAKLPNTTADTLHFTLSFNESLARPLPPGHTKLLGEFEISGVQAVVDKHGTTGRMSVHFRADESGRVMPTHAEALIDVVEEYTVKIPVAARDNETATNETEQERPTPDNSEASDKNETSVKADTVIPPVMESVTRTRRKTIKAPLKIGGPGLLRQGMTTAQLKASRAVLAALAAADLARAETSAAKNNLEAYILSTGARLSSDEDVQAVTTERQREGLQKALAATEDWLYMEGADEAAGVFRKKLAALEVEAAPMFERAAEMVQRPAAVQATRSFVEMLRKTVNAWDTIKPWVNATNITDLHEQVDELESWLQDAETRQAKLAAHEPPALHSREVTLRTESLRKHFTRLKNIKKPKPPPVIPNATAAEADNGTDSEGSTASYGAEDARASASASASAKAHANAAGSHTRASAHARGGGAEQTADASSHDEL